MLKPGGTFFICNEANGETAKDDKWTQIINGMTIYTDADLKVYLEQAGFYKIQSHKNKKGCGQSDGGEDDRKNMAQDG